MDILVAWPPALIEWVDEVNRARKARDLRPSGLNRRPSLWGGLEWLPRKWESHSEALANM